MPSDFSTGTIGDAKSDEATGFRIPCSISLLSCASTFALSANGTCLALKNFGSKLALL